MTKQLTIKRDVSSPKKTNVLTEQVREIAIPQNQATFVFNEKSFESVEVISCDYSLVKSQDLLIDVRDDALKMHFRLSGESNCYCDEQGAFGLKSGQHSLMFHNNCETKVVMDPTQNKGKFIEIMLSRNLFERFFEQGNDFQKRFLEQTNLKKHVWTDRSLQITPEMLWLLSDMQKDTYTGNLKKLYLEAKITELMLLQVDAFDTINNPNKLSTQDLDKIQYTKTLIEQNIQSPLTIQQLSGEVGLNMKKLTTGFKAVFQTTIFEYTNKQRMAEAKRLLLDQKWYVGEVSDYLGYKNPQHFTVAFKKYYGSLPSQFKD
ncbi:helix-turn-helix transcriptional regulator [Myroides marinus]|uniref:helix-turn-helix transcriptional regulator n=1 Tax=Myroides marinus TaxID=703342 RepID=UPI002578F431|nr:AraC family transcriptional regulator [Myroides marinus]MDM1352389.1 helix-turn-helix transcriptional regulator [Myroides marinus]MDM1359594.1 helix-turn-helix transcriptional regulator [Myroides marinus]MDM1366736.1 helix-turn-helix transcriptional regulator [Myroides marinus]MDM1380826.1 helix-turn-helix transcriptional regulator [Myroides marinus]MDM1388098.1 helix-turn-helix transcriptional regulator [Myroides marinus]